MAVILRDRDFLPHELEMNTLMWELFYQPIMDAMEEVKAGTFYNAQSKYPGLEKALREGSVRYENGTFTGTFNARVSRELSTFASFDRKAKAWLGRISDPSLLTVAVEMNLRREELLRRINEAIDALNANLERIVDAFRFDSDFAGLSSRIVEDVSRSADKSEDVMRQADLYEQAVSAYRDNQRRNVKNWAPHQVRRLHKMAARMEHGGASADTFSRQIMAEWGVTARKAKFLARQETNLLKASLLRTRCLDRGITRYIWRTAEDEHVREYHAALDGKVFRFGQPPVVSKDGRRGEPGEDYNCRCVAIPLSD